ncbi:hypothetical protein [Halochromatium glycolicum]|nr:hypothetical protein [Halochromatium glycolicum]
MTLLPPFAQRLVDARLPALARGSQSLDRSWPRGDALCETSEKHTITPYHHFRSLRLPMASMTIRSTYAFDTETAQAIRALAKRWNVSQAEAIRRSVRIAMEQQANEPTPAEVLAHYREQGAPRSWEETLQITEQLRQARAADDRRRTGRQD